MSSHMVVGAARPPDENDKLHHEIRDLEARLATAKARLKAYEAAHPHISHSHDSPTPPPPKPLPPSTQAEHFLLLLSDSALPLGSFAFSSGLESYLAHTPSPAARRSFSTAFLPLSVSSYAATALPFVLAAHDHPASLRSLDDQADATLVCAVGRRASVAQGRALLGIWERSFASPSFASEGGGGAGALADFSRLLRAPPQDGELPAASAHLAPLFGAVARVVGLARAQTAYVFVLAHVKALVSAAVRAGLFGPYQAQRILAGEEVRALVAAVVEREWETKAEEAGQTVPVMDLWVGRHEMLYSRIFNS